MAARVLSLVHDVAPPHPRHKQFAQFAADVAARTRDMLTIAMNPGGKVLYPGLASLEAVRSGKVPLTFVNSAFLQSVDPALGVLNLPFTVTDETKPRALVDLVADHVGKKNLKVLAVMRGADTMFIFKDRQVRAPEDLRGLKIRVAGPGVYQDIIRSLGAEPVVFPAIEMSAALARGAIDGIVTSPGGWGKNANEAPSASLVPGLLFYTYFLLADRDWFDALPAAQRNALVEAGRAAVTGKWGEMQADDARLVAELVAQGARHHRVGDVQPWKTRVEGVTRAFGQAHPEALRRMVDLQAREE